MATAFHLTAHDRLTIHYEDAGSGWIVARIEEEPAAISQGRTEQEAYANVLDALHDLTHTPTASERVARVVQAHVIEPVTQFLRL
jgi:predicted RNase H-like HicB family nuclease